MSVNRVNYRLPSTSFLLKDKIRDEKGELLYSYTPPIKTGREIKIFYHTLGIYCEVTDSKAKYVLSVCDYPKNIAHSPDRLRRFFSHTHFVIEKTIAGNYSYVRAVLSLKGGNGQDILPMYPGCALGNLIKENRLRLFMLKSRCLSLENELIKAKKERDEVQESPYYKLLGIEEKIEEQQLMIDIAEVNFNKTCTQFTSLCKEIQHLQADSPLLSIEEMLPLDISQSPIKVENRSFPSEKMSHLICNHRNANLREQVERFVSRLLSQEAPSTFITINTLNSVIGGIETMLQTESEISLVGSFITLPQVRVMDPIVIRKGAIIPDSLKKENYYMLTEAVLGAVFLGFGRHISGSEFLSQDLENEQNKRSLMASMSVFSFISQGAIPKISKTFKEVNLWDTYCNWKEVLASDPYSGYPIGFRFRKLRDILIENGIPLETES